MRIARARNIVTYMQGEHLKYLRALQELAEHHGTDLMTSHVEMRQRELAEGSRRRQAKFETTGLSGRLR